MLGKLLKHELKATSRTFIPLYIAIIVVSLLNGLFLNPNNQITRIQGIGVLLLVGLFVALGVVTIVVTVQRFNKNLLGDEGYLMFTLPVSPKMLLLSKTIVSTIWCVLSGITAMISFFIIGMSFAIKSGGFKELNLDLLWSELKKVFLTEAFGNTLLVGMELLGLMILSYVVFILIIYLSISVGQLPVFNKRRKLASFIGFFIINIIINYVVILLSGYISTLAYTIQNIMVVSYLVNITAGVILFFGTSYILEKKLNLE
ncbi:hypothetical protein [Clostridium cylindrosporum]|uniref:ABC-2 family transporter protein n=1 Tax=Clostridium cylindrosporum DSM 605 TaxID=1121307 RepID=A0A0J8G520_CLOCY|nr:hypothetical protein [Clostridium cylindrosporum]KMT22766.1 hypothetical protein CLCY_5c00020 [Clostridium cylindrosporum DSM 605]